MKAVAIRQQRYLLEFCDQRITWLAYVRSFHDVTHLTSRRNFASSRTLDDFRRDRQSGDAGASRLRKHAGALLNAKFDRFVRRHSIQGSDGAWLRVLCLVGSPLRSPAMVHRCGTGGAHVVVNCVGGNTTRTLCNRLRQRTCSLRSRPDEIPGPTSHVSNRSATNRFSVCPLRSNTFTHCHSGNFVFTRQSCRRLLYFRFLPLVCSR